VKRTSEWAASNAPSWPSIQPWISAPSIASCFVTLGVAAFFLASFSHMPGEFRGWRASQSSHAAAEAKARIGSPDRSSRAACGAARRRPGFGDAARLTASPR